MLVYSCLHEWIISNIYIHVSYRHTCSITLDKSTTTKKCVVAVECNKKRSTVMWTNDESLSYSYFLFVFVRTYWRLLFTENYVLLFEHYYLGKYIKKKQSAIVRCDTMTTKCNLYILITSIIVEQLDEWTSNTSWR